MTDRTRENKRRVKSWIYSIVVFVLVNLNKTKKEERAKEYEEQNEALV